MYVYTARSMDIFLFSDTFISKPLPFFGGLFPLFVQWEDYKASMFNVYVQYICMYVLEFMIGWWKWLVRWAWKWTEPISARK